MKGKLFTICLLSLASLFTYAQETTITIDSVGIGWGWGCTFTYDVANPNTTAGVGCDAATVTKITFDNIWNGSFGIRNPFIPNLKDYKVLEIVIYSDLEGVTFDDSVRYKGWHNTNIQVDAPAVPTTPLTANVWQKLSIDLTKELTNADTTFASLGDTILNLNTIQFIVNLTGTTPANLYIGSITLKSTVDATSLDVAEALKVITYPNPVSDILTVAQDNVQSIEVVNGNGTVVFSVENSNSISVANLATGIYSIRVTTADNKVLTNTFIKK